MHRSNRLGWIKVSQSILGGREVFWYIKMNLLRKKNESISLLVKSFKINFAEIEMAKQFGALRSVSTEEITKLRMRSQTT